MRYLSDPEFQRAACGAIVKRIYEEIRGETGQRVTDDGTLAGRDSSRRRRGRTT